MSKLDPPTELRLYVGVLIPKDKTTVSQSPLQINTKITLKTFNLIKKNKRQRFIYIIQNYSHHCFIIAMPPCFSILNQTGMSLIFETLTFFGRFSYGLHSQKFFLQNMFFSFNSQKFLPRNLQFLGPRFPKVSFAIRILLPKFLPLR